MRSNEVGFAQVSLSIVGVNKRTRTTGQTWQIELMDTVECVESD